MINLTCQECGYAAKNRLALGRHIGQMHNLKSYYATHVYKGHRLGLCYYCDKSTKFVNLVKGYQPTCFGHRNLRLKDVSSNRRKTLKDNKDKFAAFSEKVRINQIRIWESRNTSEVAEKIRNTVLKNNATLSAQERREKYSRYYHCSPQKIQELNEQGRQKCLENFMSGKSGYHNCRKGKFTPKNPKKYVGNTENIIFRSQWEAEFMNKLDLNEDVLSWGSEEVIIPYYNPVKERMARYFPDMVIRQKDKDGKQSTVVVEIKPPNEITKPVRKQGKKASTYMQECLTWVQNQSKWQAAAEWCEKHGATFVVVTKNSSNRFVILTEEQAIYGGRR